MAEAACTVCVLLDGDSTAKSVAYCGVCDAWLCDRCRRDWGRRGKAAALRATQGIAKAAQ